MNATSRELEPLAETIAHEPRNHPTGPSSESELDAMTPEAARQDHRYTFGSGARPLDGYTIKRAIGRGGFGEVYYATSDAGKEVALKLITRNLEVERRGVVQCMNLKSPNLITIYDLKTNDVGDTFVVMEYVAGPSLANVLARHPEGLPLHDVRAWLKGMVDGVAYLHDHGIVHRDLKPANMFMEEGVVKIGDYGLSKAISPATAPGHSESIGTCHYMAPEISSGKYHRPIDIYALGVVLYEMLAGRVPFAGETVQEVLMKHLTSRPDLSPLPEPYRSIVGRAMAKDPNHRPTTAFELLPAADAPRSPKVRFIGGGKEAPPADPAPSPAAPKDDVLRIGAEDSVFYIGPNTWPTRRPDAGRPGRWPWGRLVALNLRRPERPAPAPAPRPAPAPAARRPAPAPAARPTPAPTPPPSPPELPGARMRVAELAGSMLAATPLAALGALGTAGVLGLDPGRDLQASTLLYVLTLLGTWGVLATTKLWEGKTVDWGTKRFVGLLVGLLLGAAALGLGAWTRVPPAPGWGERTLVRFDGWEGPVGFALPTPLANGAALGAYLGLAFALNGWWKLTARDRSARLRIWPLAKAGVIVAILGGLVTAAGPIAPHVAGIGAGAVLTTAVVAQLVSPRDRAAAAYARYLRANRRRVA